MRSFNVNLRFFSRLLLVVALLLLSLLFLLAQAQAETFFGPEVFIRDSGKPATVTREIITDGFGSPFILHLQNGDDNGENRVSSAKVMLNGAMVLGPSDFSQQVSGHEVQVELENSSTLEVRLASAPGSTLTIWIEGTPINPNVRIVGPEGGTLEFYNGIVLQVPPGAIDREVEITIEDLPITEVDSILQSYGLIQKYFAGGFEGQPDGLSFNVPITVTIPVEPRESSGDLPLLFLVNPASGTYTLANTELRYDPTASTVSAKIQHFTDWVVAFGNDIHQEVDCNSPDPNVRCKCGNITVSEVTEDTDVAGVCFVKKAIGIVIFEDCDGDPQQEWSIREWERPDIAITPTPVEITSCTTSVTATVTNAEGKELPNDAWITWNTDASGISLSSTTGKTIDVTVPSWVGVGYIGDIEARTGCDTVQNAEIRVSRPPDFILEIKKDIEFIYSCQEMELRAEAFGTCEDATGQISGEAIPIRWDIIDGSDVVEKRNEIDPNGQVVGGLKEGFATIRATAIDNEEVFADVTVEVRDPTVEIVPGEDFVLKIDDSKDLNVLCISCPENVSWRTDSPGVVVLTDLGGNTVRVKANALGTANVFAETVNDCGEQIVDVATVTVAETGSLTMRWNATITLSSSYQVDGPSAICTYPEDWDGVWSGHITFDSNSTIVSFQTNGIFRFSWENSCKLKECNRSSLWRSVGSSTITAKGMQQVKDGLILMETDLGDGPIFLDPFGWIKFFPIEAYYTRTDTSTGYTCCEPECQPSNYSNTVESPNDYWILAWPSNYSHSPGNIPATDETGLHFSKETIINAGVLGQDEAPIRIHWLVEIEKSE